MTSPDTPHLRDPWLAAMAPRLVALAPRARAAVAGLTPRQFTAHPAQGGWSVAETLEHLVIANSSYDAPLSGAIARARAGGRPPRERANTFFGRWLLSSMSESNTAKVPTARKYRPIAVRAQVFAEFLGTLERWDALMREADGADLRTMLSSPLLGLIRMNLGEAFEIGIVHTERHLGQIERTARAVR